MRSTAHEAVPALAASPRTLTASPTAQAAASAGSPSRCRTRTSAPRRPAQHPVPAGGGQPVRARRPDVELDGGRRRQRLTTWTSTRNDREAAISSARSARLRRA